MRKCGVQGDHRLLNVAAGAGRARRSFRCPAAGRFATFGGKCPLGTRFPSRLPGFGAAPQALCRSTKRERFEWPKVTRNAGRFY